MTDTSVEDASHTPNALTVAAMEECDRSMHDSNTKAHSSVSELMRDCERPWDISDLDTISLALLSPEDKARFSAEIAKAHSGEWQNQLMNLCCFKQLP